MHTYTVRNNDKEENHLYDICRSHPWSYRPSKVHISSVAQLCLTLCDPMNRSTPGLPVHHQLPEFTQTHVHRVSDAPHPNNPTITSSPNPQIKDENRFLFLNEWNAEASISRNH